MFGREKEMKIKKEKNLENKKRFTMDLIEVPKEESEIKNRQYLRR